jgi:hypothetical protein
MDRKKVSIAKAEHPTTETNQIGTTVIPYMYKIYNFRTIEFWVM